MDSNPITSWKSFWDQEAHDLCTVMPSALVGGSALSTLCFQDSGRFVYLSRTDENKGRALEVHSSTLLAQLLSEPEHLPVPTTIEAPILFDGTNVSIDELNHEERRRYGMKSNPPESQTFIIQTAYPSPIHHESRSWWEHLPRLGVCYSIDNLLGIREKSASAEYHRAMADSILIVSSIHAGNRILSRRLSLLFGNPFDWPDQDEDHLGERIARSLCVKDQRISDVITEDHKLYFITMLLLSHHLFYPHSPKALVAFTSLGKDPNADVLIPHGWEPFPHRVDRTSSIAQCCEQLVDDMTLLIRGFVRWERPESVHRVPDSTLKSRIRRLLLTALSLICGDFEWKRSGNFYALMPCSPLRELGEMTLPALSKSRAKPIINEAHSARFLNHLHRMSPINVSAAKNYVIKMHSITYPGSGDITEGAEMQWLSRYIRARVELDAQKKIKGAVS